MYLESHDTYFWDWFPHNFSSSRRSRFWAVRLARIILAPFKHEGSTAGIIDDKACHYSNGLMIISIIKIHLNIERGKITQEVEICGEDVEEEEMNILGWTADCGLRSRLNLWNIFMRPHLYKHLHFAAEKQRFLYLQNFSMTCFSLIHQTASSQHGRMVHVWRKVNVFTTLWLHL